LAKGWVRSIGYVHQDDLPLLYASAIALLFPSIYEGFGLPVLEAMESATPALTCFNVSMSEITQGYAALVELENVKGMSELIERFSIDHAWTCSLAEKSTIRAKAFSW
jgi:alpha-1,3-rhamnosyl/mannosyltransferase